MTSSAPARALPRSASQRTTPVLLGVGTVLSLLTLLGPLWLVRVGVVLAVAAAVLTTALAWRELAQERRRHAAASLAASRSHGRVLRTERQHNAAVLQVVTERNTRAIADLERQQVTIAGLRTEVATLRGDKAALTATVARQELTLGELRTTVRAQEAELAARPDHEAAEADSDEAQVHAMPRRVLLETDAPREDLWSDGDHPTVADLPAVHAPLMPNFEADRRGA